MSGFAGRAALCAGFIALLSAFEASAACPGTIVNGETQTTTQVLTNDQECAVEQGGAISTVGNGAEGITGGADNTITNNGAITTNGDQAEGIEVFGDGNTITNNGVLTTLGDSSEAIFTGGDNTTIVNTGTITTTGFQSEAIRTLSDNNTIVNRGVISTSGDFSEGIEARESNVVNSGTIVVTGANAFSINFVFGTNTLTLLQNSRIVGLISLGAGADTVNLGRGENWLMTFDENPTQGGNTLGTAGRPFALLNGGLTVATFDAATTVFGEEDEALADLTGAINAGLHYRLTAGNPTGYIWTQAFGGERDADQDDRSSFETAEDEANLRGFMSGFNAPLADWARGGLFAGYAEADINGARAASIGENSRRHEIEQEGWFGGAFGRAFMGNLFADVIVTGGQSDHDSRRRILNNLTSTGVEFASGGYDGWFINPEVTVGAELPVMGVLVVPSASLGYAGLYLDGFRETGSLASVAFADRNVEIIDGRLQVEVRNRWDDFAGSWLTLARVGVKGRANVGDDDLSGVLANTTAFTFSLEDDDDVGAVFAGGDMTWSPFANVQFFAGAEGAIESEGDTVLHGRAGGSVKF